MRLKTKALTVGGAVLVTIMCVYSNKPKTDPHKMNYTQQEFIFEQIDYANLQLDRIVEKVNETNEIILLTEYGQSEINYSKVGTGFVNLWTKSDISVQCNYKAIITLPSQQITFTKINNDIYVNYDLTALEVKSIEIIDKSIVRNKEVFAKSYDDNEVIALEKSLLDAVRNEILTDDTIVAKANLSITNYLNKLSSDLNVPLNVQ